MAFLYELIRSFYFTDDWTLPIVAPNLCDVHDRHALSLHIGCASGFSGDRSDGAPAVVRTLAARGGGTLIFETLAERTLALAQLARNEDPRLGYEPLLDDLVGPVLGDCQRHGIAIVSNFGASQPAGRGAAHRGTGRAAGLTARRVSRWCTAMRWTRPNSATCCANGWAGRWTAWTWSARPPTRARPRSPRRWSRARRSWSPAAWRILR